ncbi:MFS transporter, partial [Escherichia coli]|nr:MFS transporter [Escherichia coli]
MKNPYFPTALGLYFNYLVHGMGVILMSLNMASLETLWQTNAAGGNDSNLLIVFYVQIMPDDFVMQLHR